MSRLYELRHIADLIGIVTRHVDALGIWHEPDEETLAKLIAAFGLPSEPQRAAEALGDAARAAPFGLDPVHIVAQEAPATLRLRIDSGDADWHCRLEEGGERSGRSNGSELSLPSDLPPGYHRLAVSAAGRDTEISLIVAPAACHLPDALRPGARSWGLTAQLYGLRSAHNWGVGDFSDLAALSRHAGGLGAAALGINPLHALFAAEPRHSSPYSPSSRIWLNWLYIDVTAAPGFAEDAAARSPVSAAALARARDGDLVDYAAAAALKRPVLEALFRQFRAQDQSEFWQFRQQGGDALQAFATFEALHEYFIAAGGPFSWQEWPATMRDPHSPEVAKFAKSHAERIEFFSFLQWLADRQLAAAAAAGRDAGLAIGLYRDLAVGVDPHGAEAWADQQLVVPGMAIGAPPDPLSRAGQNWGLAPLSPLALRRSGYAGIIAALRANMQHAGILRIDHVMGLQRLYWIPRGSPATAGAYVNYPFRDLLRLVTLESQRNRCAVIGEDLGTLPEGFRETMQQANSLSYRIFAFERRWDGSFIPPGEYPPLAAASAATHDLATLKGFWLGRDIEWRQRLGLYPDKDAETGEIDERRRARQALLEALVREALLPAERWGEFLSESGEPSYGQALADAIHAYLGRSRARLMLVQLEDIVGEGEQANLPGTTDAHPNWRRRLAVSLDELFTGEVMSKTAALVGEARRQAPGE